MNRYFSLLLVPFIYKYPWEISIILTLTCFKHKKLFYISFLSQISLLPQHLGYYYSYISHNIYDINYHVLPAILLLIAQQHLENIKINWEVKVFAFLIAICAHDLLYRVVTLLQVFCIWLVAKSLFMSISKYFYKKTT